MVLGCFDNELVSFLCLCLRQMLHPQKGVGGGEKWGYGGKGDSMNVL